MGKKRQQTNEISRRVARPHLGILTVHHSDWRTTYKCLLSAERRMPKTRTSATSVLLNHSIQAEIFWLSKFPFLRKISSTLQHKTISPDLLLFFSHLVAQVAQLSILWFS